MLLHPADDNRQPPQSPAQPSTHHSVPIVRWRCPNCGQTHFTTADDAPPDICAYCKDMTTWQRVDENDD